MERDRSRGIRRCGTNARGRVANIVDSHGLLQKCENLSPARLTSTVSVVVVMAPTHGQEKVARGHESNDVVGDRRIQFKGARRPLRHLE